jgi:hypothetical protein
MNTAAVLDRGTALGYVEARTADRILGWAWDPAAPETRLEVVLLRGKRIVARTRADQPREDLARNGVGDGAHAFAFVLDEALRGEAGRLDVAVEAEGGALVPLGAARADQGGAAIAQVQRGLAALVAGQRAVLRTIEALPARSALGEAALRAIDDQQRRIEASIAALELAVARLDERLAASTREDEGVRLARRPLVVAAVLGALGAAAIVWAVAPALG